MRLQAHIDPSSHDVTGLRVFVSYKTEDYELARRAEGPRQFR